MRIEHITEFSTILNRRISYRVILPENASGKSLYLLHGYGEDSSCWLVQTKITDWAELNGITVIMPDAGDGYYQDNEQKKEWMKRFIGEELIAMTRKAYRLSEEKRDTWIAGVSMGGFGSLLIGSCYDNTFGKIGCIAGSFVIPSLVIWDFSVLGNKLSTRDYFLDCFGDFEKLEGGEKDPMACALKSFKREKMPELFPAGLYKNA